MTNLFGLSRNPETRWLQMLSYARCSSFVGRGRASLALFCPGLREEGPAASASVRFSATAVALT